MWNFLQGNQFVVGALTGSLATYLLNLLVSFLWREKRWLGYSVSSRNIVQSGHTKIAITYSGLAIRRLDSHTVHLRNIGNRPLVQQAVRLEALGGGQIVDHEVHPPDGAKYSVVPEGRGGLVLTTDLINPGEVVALGLTVADSSEGGLKILARGELLRVKEIGVYLNDQELRQELRNLLLAQFPFFGIYHFYRLSRSHRSRRTLP